MAVDTEFLFQQKHIPLVEYAALQQAAEPSRCQQSDLVILYKPVCLFTQAGGDFPEAWDVQGIQDGFCADVAAQIPQFPVPGWFQV